ncbi:hypothetical protein N0V83_006267 [Neocucurbitaria cava]|uniref:Uncharacterized protein n=1 Tax=Neocucurbitaria cava TaxID=798079 RepID=A0A9W8Y6D4_9PLEO|nr:hypothetical protein N0V83_006267 [Neocucurbitaria cava]
MFSILFFILLPLILAILLKFNMPPLASVKSWSPFKIDALGIVTLLGADAVRKSLGRLTYSPFEYFPLLAGHIFADNSVADPIPGFILYNITEGMKATDLSAWFTRWLLCQKVTYSATKLKITGTTRGREPTSHHSRARTIALVLNSFLIIWPLLSSDWYGSVASFSLVGLVAVRIWTLRAMRQSLDANFEQASSATKSSPVNLFISLPTGERITVTTTTGITQDCLLTEARPKSSWNHMIAQTIAWVAFGIHVVSLGMACLAVQLALLISTLACSVAVVRCWWSEGWNSEEHRLGSRMVIKRSDTSGVQSMAKMYVLLGLNDEEEQNMVDWSLIPTRSSRLWLPTYRQFKEDARHDPSVLDTWGNRLRQAYEDDERAQAAAAL